MSDEHQNSRQRDEGEPRPYQVRLPGFVSEKAVGLGDVITYATSVIGIKGCGGCAKRAAALNRRLTFSGRRPR